MNRRRRIVILSIAGALALTFALSTLGPGASSPEPRSTVAPAPTTTAPRSPTVTTVRGPVAPATTQPASSEPATTPPASTEPDTTVPDTTQPDTTRPATTRPATTRPATTQPATTGPATTRPSTTRPTTTTTTTLPVLGSPVACAGAPTIEAAEEIAVGLPEEEAVVGLFMCGWELRVTRRDGVDLAATDDLRPNRVNVAVVDGEVTKVLSIG